MYSQKRVAERLAIATREFGITPEYHTVDDVIEFDRHLVRRNMYTYSDQGQPSGTQHLTEFETQWMLNEQVLCLCDASYGLTRYGFVKNEEGIVQRFQFRIPQRLLYDIICDLEDRGLAIEIMILKARQLGMSTLTELLIAFRIIFSYGVNAVIGSADQSKTTEMARMLLFCYDMLPCWLRPTSTSRVESDRGKLMFGHLASGVSFQHGAQKLGIATGSTPTLYHLSEVALYTDCVKLIDEGLWKAVHASAHVFGILESTGRSNKGWWADTWYYSRDKWPESRMCPLFLPWFCGVDIYPKPAWLAARPLRDSWRANHDTRLHAAKCELYVRSHPLLARHLGAAWTMPLAQQWFWEVTHEEAKAKGAESSFLQEMAGDDEEALQHSEESVFGHATMREIDAARERAYSAYTIVGQSIEAEHEVAPDYFDYTRERIPVRYLSRKGEPYRWELIPLKPLEAIREDDHTDADGALFIWHHPTPGVSYSIGVDTSAGKGQDSTVISVWTYGTRGQPDVQVAEYASSHVNHVEAFAFVMAIAAYYARHMAAGVTRWREPYVSIEQVQAVGDTCQGQMQRMGYGIFHMMPRYDASLKRIARAKSPGGKMGWYTYGYTRGILTGNFVHSARNGWAEINSPWLIEEMRHFEVHETSTGKEKFEHEEGEHDDRIFAAAMAIFCPHDKDNMAERSRKRIAEPDTLPPLDLSPSRGHSFSSRDGSEKSMLTIDDLVYSSDNLDQYRR